jgi:Trk K+ transport system NAD-binding subunit
VIAGFGDVGRGAYEELRAAGVSCMVVDAKSHDMEQVVGNAEDEGVLKKARIEEARFCIVALNDDDVNIFTTLMARNLNPVIRILSRANDPASVEKLYRAGADYVALLPMIGGQTIARIILEGYMTILLDLPDRDIVVMKRVQAARPGSVASYNRKSGIRIIGIEGPGRSIVAPSPEEVLLNSDDVIAVGDTEQLKKFIRQL